MRLAWWRRRRTVLPPTPGLIHWDGHRRPCTPGDEVAAPHLHGDELYGGPDHERLEAMGERGLLR